MVYPPLLAKEANQADGKDVTRGMANTFLRSGPLFRVRNKV